MTQEEKQLLLQYLSAALPYGVMVNVEGYDTEKLIGIENETIITKATPTSYSDKGVFPIDIVKPYLRPMSSMTLTENQEYNEFLEDLTDYDNHLINTNFYKLQDWLNKHHFDYRDLISKGLVIAVTKEDNPYED